MDPLSFGIAEKTDTTGKFYLGFKDSKLEFDYELSTDEGGENRVTFHFTDKEGHKHVYTVKTQLGEESKVSLDISNSKTGDNINMMVRIKKPRHVSMDIVKNGEIVFSVEANVNPADFSWDLSVESMGKKYTLQGRIAIKGDFKLNIEGDVAGPVSFNMLMKKDYSESKLELNHKRKK